GDLRQYQNQKERDATYDWLFVRNAKSPGAPLVGRTLATYSDGLGGTVTVTMLCANATGKRDSMDTNTNSIVLLLEYADYKIFLMGDATKETEEFILNAVGPKNYNLPTLLANARYATLELGHHGSWTSSTEAWLKALTPDGLVVSSDTRNFNGSGI